MDEGVYDDIFFPAHWGMSSEGPALDTYEGVDDGLFPTAPPELSFGFPALDTSEFDAYPGVSGVAELADSEGSSETWNNGASDGGLSESGYIDPQLLLLGGAGMDIPPQGSPGQSVAGLGSSDGSQVAIEAL